MTSLTERLMLSTSQTAPFLQVQMQGALHGRLVCVLHCVLPLLRQVKKRHKLRVEIQTCSVAQEPSQKGRSWHRPGSWVLQVRMQLRPDSTGAASSSSERALTCNLISSSDAAAIHVMMLSLASGKPALGCWPGFPARKLSCQVGLGVQASGWPTPWTGGRAMSSPP